LWELTHVLRRECPWDQVQTAATIVPHTLEEAWETADAARTAQRAVDEADVSADERAAALADFEDELGDLIFQVCFLAMWCGEQTDGAIDLGSVATRIFEKLVRRHPHVFGEAAMPEDANAVLTQWDQVKRDKERRGPFAGIPDAMPAVARARKVQSRAANMGFEYGDVRGALADLEDEVRELREAIDAADAAGTLPDGASAPPDPHTEAELGDVIYAAVNVARFLRVDPELATSDATRTFQSRVERAMHLAAVDGGADPAADPDAGSDGAAFTALDTSAQEALYQRAKRDLRGH
jgi:MazG family protein